MSDARVAGLSQAFGVESFLHFYIYHQTENREFIGPKIHKTHILPKVGNMTLLLNLGKPGFYGVGLPGRVISCQPWLSDNLCWLILDMVGRSEMTSR